KDGPMFIGRTVEMSELNRLYGTGSFEMPVIYGRRRVGKTRLITEFIQDKKAIYFQARRTNAEANLHGFSQAILAGSVGAAGVSFRSFDEAFDALATMARTERLIVVIDEYPYLAQSNPEISSLLQDKIDHLYKETRLMLILCGSSLSFMEEQVLGYESPLYGRRTAQFKIMPLDFTTTLGLWQSMSREDAAVCYGMTGGIPAYIERVDPAAPLKDNIKRLFLTPTGYLFEEPSNLLLQDGLIQNDMAEMAYERIEPHVSDYMGTVFELICRQYVYELARAGQLDVVPASVGRWWGTDNRTHTQEEIDLIVDDGEGTALFAECKWRNEPVGEDVLQKLVHRSELFRRQHKSYAIFSKRGFTQGCQEAAASRGDAKLISFAEMCERR
ncbi:MAG: AAA family ATPase, partial [Collinsella sp.]|nr:AAA family ATPase [Collinsella sp.]